ncbi:MAG TPA: class I SAM-dependent methyltransferase [Ktedonobacterales bacterium]
MSDSISFDRVADRYDETRGYSDEVARRIAEGIIREGRLQPGAHLIELGIGTGRIALPLLTRGIHITGVDISAEMMSQLKRRLDAWDAQNPGKARGTLTLRAEDMTQLPFPDGAFDGVIAVHVFHLVPKWERALDEALRVLRPGAPFLLGQDASQQDAPIYHIQDIWVSIMLELEHPVVYAGARSRAQVIEALRQRGRAPVEKVIATWDKVHTPRQVLSLVGDQIWSRTWDVPDDVFRESVRDLTEIVYAEYGDQMDTPQSSPFEFRLTRA